MWVAYLIIFIVVLVAAIALAPKPPDQKPATLDDLQMPTAEPGRPIPVVFGTYLVKGVNVVWYGDLLSIPIKSKGGK